MLSKSSVFTFNVSQHFLLNVNVLQKFHTYRNKTFKRTFRTKNMEINDKYLFIELILKR